MRLPLLLCCTLILVACSTPTLNDAAANQFQSLTKNQQAAYWQAKQRQYTSAELEKLGIQVLNNGERYQLIIPANLLFKNSTQMTATTATDTYQKIVQLINSEPTSSIRINAYSRTGNSTRDYALTQSWAQTVLTRLREEGLSTALLSAQGKGTCFNYAPNSPFSAHIEITYRIQERD